MHGQAEHDTVHLVLEGLDIFLLAQIGLILVKELLGLFCQLFLGFNEAFRQSGGVVLLLFLEDRKFVKWRVLVSAFFLDVMLDLFEGLFNCTRIT